MINSDEFRATILFKSIQINSWYGNVDKTQLSLFEISKTQRTTEIQNMSLFEISKSEVSQEIKKCNCSPFQTNKHMYKQIQKYARIH